MLKSEFKPTLHTYSAEFQEISKTHYQLKDHIRELEDKVKELNDTIDALMERIMDEEESLIEDMYEARYGSNALDDGMTY